MRKLLIVLLALAAYAANASAYAGESVRVLRCDNCSYGQMELKASQERVGYMVNTEIFVVDMANGDVRKWIKSKDYETQRTFFFPVSVDGATKDAFLSVRDTYLRIMANADNVIEIPSSDFSSIYEISGCPACANVWVNENVISIANQIPLYDAFHEQLGDLALQFGVPNGALALSLQLESGLTYKVVLKNDDAGGPLPAFCTGALSATGFEVDSSKCHDSDGNEIPVSVSDISFRYRFTRLRNLGNFEARLDGIGVTFIGTGTVTVGDPVTVDCTEDQCEAK